MPSIERCSRRQLLALAGGAGVAAAGGFAAGVGYSPDDCTPSPLASDSTDWPFPRQDAANTGTAPARAGPEELTAAWRREWPLGRGHRSGPLAVADGTVLVPLEASPRSAVLAVSLADGTEQWRYHVDGTRGAVLPLAGTAFTSIRAVDGPGEELQARNLADGAVLWSRDASADLLTVADGRVLAFGIRQRDGWRVTALDPRSGDVCWTGRGDGHPLAVGVADGRVVVATRDAGLQALDPATGEAAWQADTGGDSAAIVGDRIVASRFPGSLRAVDLADGSVEWRVESEHYVPGGTADGEQFARPSFEVGAVTSELVVSVEEVHSDYPSRLQARDLRSGDAVWEYGPEPDPENNRGYSLPAVAGDRVYVVETDYAGDGHRLLGLDLGDGTEHERVEVDARPLAPPVVADGLLLLATGEDLRAYGDA